MMSSLPHESVGPHSVTLRSPTTSALRGRTALPSLGFIARLFLCSLLLMQSGHGGLSSIFGHADEWGGRTRVGDASGEQPEPPHTTRTPTRTRLGCLLRSTQKRGDTDQCTRRGQTTILFKHNFTSRIRRKHLSGPFSNVISNHKSCFPPIPGESAERPDCSKRPPPHDLLAPRSRSVVVRAALTTYT